MLDADCFGFIERCRQHRSSTAVLDDLLTSVRSLGFEHLILSGVPVGGQKLAPMVELMGWPDGWFDRYIEAEHAKTDAVCIYSAKTLQPFFWSDIPDRWSDTDSNRRVEGEAAEFGIRSGFAVPMLSVDHWQSVLSFASGQPKCTLPDRHQAQLISMAIFAAISIEAMSHGETDVAPLSSRENEILLWSAGGKSAWAIGEILNISSRTVIKHQESARRKLGVATTIQAVVEAIRRRMIHP
jgi:LuxR family quorum sensing-dependent transcriptional regulator